MTESRYRLFKAVWLCALGITIALLAQPAEDLLRELKADSAKSSTALQSAATSLADVKTLVQNEAKANQDHLDAEFKETKKATADIHDLIIHTDVSLNGKRGDGGILGDIHANIAPRVARMVDDSDTAIVHASRAVDLASLDSQMALSRVPPLLDALTVRIQDPRYDEILANAATSMQNLAGMTADGKQMTADTAAFVHRELAPARGTWNVVKAFLREFAGPAAEVATAVK